MGNHTLFGLYDAPLLVHEVGVGWGGVGMGGDVVITFTHLVLFLSFFGTFIFHFHEGTIMTIAISLWDNNYEHSAHRYPLHHKNRHNCNSFSSSSSRGSLLTWPASCTCAGFGVVGWRTRAIG